MNNGRRRYARVRLTRRGALGILRPLLCLVAICLASGAARAGDGSPEPRAVSPLAPQGGSPEPFIVPIFGGLVNPADFQEAGVLQIEYGIDALFEADAFEKLVVAPVHVRFAAHDRLLLFATVDAVVAQQNREDGPWQAGFGPTYVGVHVVAVEERDAWPVIGFSYTAKLPTADDDELGTGRVDHELRALLSKSFGKTSVDLNGAAIWVGPDERDGWVAGGFGGIAVSHAVSKEVTISGELSGLTKDFGSPPGLYTFGILVYKPTERFALNTGVRVGLTEDAPRFGAFVGVTVGVADFYD